MQFVNDKEKFSFQQINVHTVKEVKKVLPSNKATAGEIPIKNSKKSGFTFGYLTSRINEIILSGKFLDWTVKYSACLQDERSDW